MTEAHVLAGDCDFLLRVVAEDLPGLRRFQSEHLARIKGVRSMKTDIPLLKVKNASFAIRYLTHHAGDDGSEAGCRLYWLVPESIVRRSILPF
ncbi:Lrp/AsnC ligand binding domain-containing protein [Komagataeibacter oboediens]|uniref:Lrp/AsnC ligand binding domain-containing protein n=1 Tax=Komagataeibacter oboediens TaxID=65958 RepID=UPI0034649FD9